MLLAWASLDLACLDVFVSLGVLGVCANFKWACHRYAEYEMKLEELRALRKETMGITGKRTLADYAIVRRVHFIFERATRKFRGDMRLWMRWLEYCKASNSPRQTSKVNCLATAPSVRASLHALHTAELRSWFAIMLSSCCLRVELYCLSQHHLHAGHAMQCMAWHGMASVIRTCISPIRRC